MRVSSLCLIVVAGSLVFASGCKSQRRSGVSHYRPLGFGTVRRTNDVAALASRGTAECDCYTCRTKREAESYLVEEVGQPVDTAPAAIEGDMVVPGAIEPDTTPVQPAPEAIVQPPEQEQAVPSQVIEDVAAPSLDVPEPPPASLDDALDLSSKSENPAASDADGNGRVGSSRVVYRPRVTRQARAPQVSSMPIQEEVSVAKAAVTPNVASPAKRENSIWFAPVVSAEPMTGSENMLPVPAITSRVVEPVVSVYETQPIVVEPAPTVPGYVDYLEKVVASQSVAPAPVEAIQPVSVPVAESTIVLRAVPVARHTVYNGRSYDAPVRVAQLADGPTTRYSFEIAPGKNYFQELPPISQRIRPSKPAISPLTPMPTPATGEAERSNESASSAIESTDHSQQMKLLATPVASGATLPTASVTHAPSRQPISQPAPVVESPNARVVQPTRSSLTLSAVSEVGPSSLPPIANFHNMEETVIGSLHVQPATGPTSTQSKASPQTQVGNNNERNRLVTSPWRPMQLGPEQDLQVSRSIRRLTIHPQNVSKAGRDTIDR